MRRKDKPCNHKFIDINAVVIENHIRMVSTCKKCGIAIHRKVYSTNKLKEIENE